VMSVLLSYLLFLKKEKRPLYRCFGIFGNVGFIGYPMIIAMIGAKALLIASIFNILYSILIFSLGMYLMCQYREDENHEIKKFSFKVLINPATIASVIAVALLLLKIELPTVIDKTAKMLGSLTTPLAMLVVGASLNKIRLKEVVKSYRVIIISLVKLTVFPITMAYLLRSLGFSGIIAMVAIVLVGMPIGTTLVLFANQYNSKNVVDASEAVVMSTILLLLTIPILTFAVNIVR